VGVKMKDINDIEILVNPTITNDQLFAFYQRNHVCEEGYGKEIACKPLSNSSVIIGAFEEDRLIGIARAMFDGLSAVIMEFCVELEWQGRDLEYNNGSLIGKDDFKLGKSIGETLTNELFKMGANFILYDIVKDYEEAFYESLGFEPHPGSIIYYIDKRPYLGDERYMTKRRDPNKFK
jgi:hypothetical protein